MVEIVLATQNEHKIFEINAIAEPFGVKFSAPQEGFDPIEEGQTFEENSYSKALCAAKIEKSGRKYFMADDSGLCCDYLNGAPGILSARYADTPQGRIDKLLDAHKEAGENERGAKFVCSLVLVDKEGKILNKTMGICKGKIAKTQFGKNGFGYDPIFIVEGQNKTMAELSEEEKNKISHRGRALIDMLVWIKCNF